jgi:hypothetical protein
MLAFVRGCGNAIQSIVDPAFSPPVPMETILVSAPDIRYSSHRFPHSDGTENIARTSSTPGLL